VLEDHGDDGFGSYGHAHPLPTFSDGIDTCEWGPTQDFVELLDSPANLLHQGKTAPGIPIFLGSNRDEGSQFAFTQVFLILKALECGQVDMMRICLLSDRFGQRCQILYLHSQSIHHPMALTVHCNLEQPVCYLGH
jgi:hypothetical protein